MKAAIFKSYGSPEVMEISEVDKPSIKDEDRVLIRVVSASVNQYDNLFRKGYFPTRIENGLTKPKTQILGIDVAGTVEAIGENVTKFKVGDSVFGSCVGSHAEYVCPRQSVIALMPNNSTFEEQLQCHVLHRLPCKHCGM
ncbi:alcohol dehydrogenase catalytic domain-containing protein [Bacillus haimaensis]|uniref:alcohol dehydrogenase catalytic domain-containing protein n=1 Tax=Bacillus haimaensis TaxID=3160967 RepID=UPI003AA840CF